VTSVGCHEADRAVSMLVVIPGDEALDPALEAFEALHGAKPGLSTTMAVSSSIAMSLRWSRTHNPIDIKTKPQYPESTGSVERLNGTVRSESDSDYGNDHLQAEAVIAKLMHHYDEERLHATLDYMAPATWHRGQPDEVRDWRARRIAAGP
jgi:transposase InsO family protein